jgi:sugar-specific transcriptional regulator TrmB
LLSCLLAEKIVSSPNKFSAIPICDALAILFQKRKNELTELNKKTGILLEKYSDLQKNALEEKTAKEKVCQFVLIPDKEPLIRERDKALNNAKQKILIMIPLKKLNPVLTHSFESFNQAIERKVSFQIITEQTENKIKIQKLFEGLEESVFFEVRSVPPPIPANFAVYDGKEIRLSTSSKSEFAGAPDIWSNNSDIIEFAQDYFKMKWATATPTKI